LTSPFLEIAACFIGRSAFAARSIGLSAIIVSDGLWCFGAVQIVGVDYERMVTGGGRASTKLAQFKR
jgi:hypothetical protein